MREPVCCNPALGALPKPCRWDKQQQNSRIGIYVTYPSYPIGAQRGTGTITHLCGVYHPFTLTDFWDLVDFKSQRKSDKRHSLICKTVTVFIAFRHLFAELCDDKIITWDDFWCNLNGSSFWQFWTLSSVMMPASLLLRESKTSQKSEAKSSQLIFSSSLDRDYRLQKYKKISD